MQFTGTELTRSRSIYTQNTNFGWAMDCYVNNTTGRYEFGVSGVDGALAFTLESGRILAGTTFLHSYAANERFYLECQVTTSTYNLIKDEVPLVMGAGKTSGDYSNLYFHRTEPTLFADFNFHASGQNLPNVAIDDVGYLLTTGQNAVTGQYLNNGSYPVRVFDSEAFYAQGLDFGVLAGSIAKQGSGQFAFTGDFTSFDFTNPILVDFATNYNNARVAFTIIDARSQSSFVYLQPTTFDFNGSGILARNVLFNNYSGGFQVDSFPTEITFTLTNVSGTGIVVGGDSYTTTGYGNLIESGLLTGVATTITGDIVVSQFAWATGAASGFFSGVGTGYATGAGYSGSASGFYTGFHTGFIHEGSGTLVVGLAVGLGVGNSVSLSQDQNATGLYPSGGSTSPTFGYNRVAGISPRLEAAFGSGSPVFTRSVNNGTIYWGSGEDILYGISGMTVGFGLTGHMVGQKLYLFSTGLNLNGAGTRLRITNPGNSIVYPGIGYMTGASASGVATGYLDLSTPFYMDDVAFQIYGFIAGRSITCRYRPPEMTYQDSNVSAQLGDEAYRGYYTDAIHLASGINKWPGIGISATAVGERINLAATDVGEHGNLYQLYYGSEVEYLGLTGSSTLIGGTVSTAATGYMEIIPFPAFSTANLYDYGSIGINSDTGSLDVWFQRFPAPAFYGVQNCYYRTAGDIARFLSGSAVGSLFYNGVASGDYTMHLTANSPGTGGNQCYFMTGAPTHNFTGGGEGSYFTAIPVSDYTGNLTNRLVTGEGYYSDVISQSGEAYYKTFTGTWNLYTGLSQATLASAKLASYTESQISAEGTFPPNTQLSFQVTRTAIDSRPDGAQLVISGSRVLNPINETLSFP